jgi:hypothetical protein
MARHGTARHSTAQHGTARHSTARPDTHEPRATRPAGPHPAPRGPPRPPPAAGRRTGWTRPGGKRAKKRVCVSVSGDGRGWQPRKAYGIWHMACAVDARVWRAATCWKTDVPGRTLRTRPTRAWPWSGACCAVRPRRRCGRPRPCPRRRRRGGLCAGGTRTAAAASARTRRACAACAGRGVGKVERLKG